MASCMRCDACGALRWYGRPLQREHIVEWQLGDTSCLEDGCRQPSVFGPRERIMLVCEICSEQRNIALWPPDWEPYQPTMHPPHRRAQ